MDIKIPDIAKLIDDFEFSVDCDSCGESFIVNKNDFDKGNSKKCAKCGAVHNLKK